MLGTTSTFAGKPPAPTNQTPVVTAFDVAAESASPVTVDTFTATDADGTIAGYLITETSAKPSANAGGWSPTEPTQYVTSSVGPVTLYAWAKDDKDAVSNSLSDTVTISDPTQARLAALEAQVAELQSLLAHFSRNGNDITITGANVHIVNGSGSTNVPIGVGNLIIGYNEMRNDGTDLREGSHNLVVGRYNSYSSFGGVVLGESNTISGPFAMVTGGSANTGSGSHSTVIGGVYNQSAGSRSVAGGGENLIAAGLDSTTIGGSRNTASGERSVVLGGDSSVAAGAISVSVGGVANLATGNGSTITGGTLNTTFAGSDYAVISGGYQVTVSGWYDWAAGSLFQDQ